MITSFIHSSKNNFGAKVRRGGPRQVGRQERASLLATHFRSRMDPGSLESAPEVAARGPAYPYRLQTRGTNSGELGSWVMQHAPAQFRLLHAGLQASRTSRPVWTGATHSQQPIFLGSAVPYTAKKKELLFSWNFGGCTLVLYIIFIVRQHYAHWFSSTDWNRSSVEIQWIKIVFLG